jgi:uncharacterized protein (TIGR03067 family)
MRRSVALLLLVAVPALADDKDKDLTGDLKALQGAWTAMVGPQKDAELTLTLKGTEISLHVVSADGDATDLHGKIKLDDKANPKKFDLVEMVGPDNNDIPDVLTIYELKGDKFKICGSRPGQDRPTEFKDDPDKMITVTVFKKKKA